LRPLVRVRFGLDRRITLPRLQRGQRQLHCVIECLFPNPRLELEPDLIGMRMASLGKPPVPSQNPIRQVFSFSEPNSLSSKSRTIDPIGSPVAQDWPTGITLPLTEGKPIQHDEVANLRSDSRTAPIHAASRQLIPMVDPTNTRQCNNLRRR